MKESVFYTKEEQEFREDIRAYVQKNISSELIEQIIDGGRTQNFEPLRKAIKILGKKGLMGSIHSKKYGGTERGMVGEALAAEEVAKLNGALELTRLVTSTLFGMPLSFYGSEEQKEKYLPKICSGEYLGCIAMTEDEAGSDLANMQCKVRREGDDYVVNGHKKYTTNGGIAELVALFAVLEDIEDKDPRKRMIGLLVDTTKTKGFKVAQQFDLAGMEGASNVRTEFNEMVVPGNMRLGVEGQGWEILMSELNEERCGMAADCVGFAQESFNIALKYSNERVQFGRPISRQQAVSFRIADAYTKIQAARLLTLEAARYIDMHSPLATMSASIAFAYGSEMLLDVSEGMLLTLAGEGVANRAKQAAVFHRMGPIMWVVGGTTDVQKHIIQRELYMSLKKKK
ncbi:MAG: acyl-CoA dehydrogenase family protein [Promethearchaeota archaeon]